MHEKIKQYQIKYYPYITQLRDIRAIGLLVFVVIVLLISWSGAKAIQTNYNLQKQVAQLEQTNAVQGLENKNLQLQNEYFNTNQYLELTARQNFGLGAAGETELIVPKSVALENIVKVPGISDRAKASSKQPLYQRNFEAWMSFLLHRQSQ